MTSITNYKSHHGVTNVNKYGKVRVVYDAAADFNNTSLNKNLLKGPYLLNNLLGILIRFRRERYGVMTDIEQMFHQIYVRSKERDLYVWLTWLAFKQREGNKCVNRVKQLLSKGGFNLTNFSSNNHDILNSLTSTNTVKSADINLYLEKKFNGTIPRVAVATRVKHTENQISREKASHNQKRDLKFH